MDQKGTRSTLEAAIGMSGPRFSYGSAEARINRVLLLGMLVVHAVLLTWGAARHAPTFDEVGHVAAGLSHWRFSRFDLYRVNPPLPRLIGTLPLVFVPHEEDWTGWELGSDVRFEFAMGGKFIAANGERSQLLFTIARICSIPFSLLGAWACYLLAATLYGDRAGLAASSLWCFSPTILGHACLLTPDVPAAALGVLTVYRLVAWLGESSWPNALLVGAAAGAALSAKSTWIILLIILPLAAVAHELRTAATPRQVLSWLARRFLPQILSIFVLMLTILNLAYAFTGVLHPLESFEFRSNSLTGLQDSGGEYGNRFRGSVLGRIPVPLPADFVIGIDRQKMEFEIGKPAYAAGTFQLRGGWWWYYLYAAAVKLPVGTLALLFTSCLFLRRGSSPLGWIVPLMAVLLFFMVSSQTGINKHFRYVLPMLPLLFVWVGRCGAIRNTRQWTALLIVAMIMESLWCYPHNLSFFNVLSGGPHAGPKHLLNTNVSWGQDNLRLRAWQQTDPENRSDLYTSLLANYDLEPLGIMTRDNVELVNPNPGPDGPLRIIRPGWYAIDVNFLYGYPYLPLLDAGGQSKIDADTKFWTQFQKRAPDYQLGYSIFIFHVQDTDESTEEVGLDEP